MLFRSEMEEKMFDALVYSAYASYSSKLGVTMNVEGGYGVEIIDQMTGYYIDPKIKYANALFAMGFPMLYIIKDRSPGINSYKSGGMRDYNQLRKNLDPNFIIGKQYPALSKFMAEIWTTYSKSNWKTPEGPANTLTFEQLIANMNKCDELLDYMRNQFNPNLFEKNGWEIPESCINEIQRSLGFNPDPLVDDFYLGAFTIGSANPAGAVSIRQHFLTDTSAFRKMFQEFGIHPFIQYLESGYVPRDKRIREKLELLRSFLIKWDMLSNGMDWYSATTYTIPLYEYTNPIVDLDSEIPDWY